MAQISDEYYFKYTDWWMDIPFTPGPDVTPSKWAVWQTTIHAYQEAFWLLGASVKEATLELNALAVSLRRISGPAKSGTPPRGVGEPRINNTGPRGSRHFDRRGRKLC